MSSPTSTSRITHAQTHGRLSAKTVRKLATSAEQPSMPLKSPQSQQANIDLNAIAHRTCRAQAAPEDAVAGTQDSNDPDGDELADVFARTAPSTPEAQWQSESASGDSDAVSEEMPENCTMQEGTALDNRDESSSVRHVGGREPRL
ncbi:hypothetical protein B0H14DRAFT_3468846 [Mycena olivaceomarginata]|nr:hypothetical protein B0H14DRAFT_3468846 [Mycena olivaceomarginata]